MNIRISLSVLVIVAAVIFFFFYTETGRLLLAAMGFVKSGS
jgi:predicted membrane-bound mannosyltransferase